MPLRLFLLGVALFFAPPRAALAGSEPDLASHPVYAKFQFGREAKVLDMGTQPLAVPLGVVGEVIQHDRTLKKMLAEQGWEFRGHGFLKGPDVNFFLQRGDLDLAMSGDFPTISFAAGNDVAVAALIMRGFSSILARDVSQLSGLKGTRVGLAQGTTAHYGLLMALENGGLKEGDVTIVSMENSEVLAALEQGRVDAISCWEPVVTAALRTHPELKVVQRTITTNYLYFSKEFVRNNPEITELMLAAYVRALRWMRQSDAHLKLAVGWQLAASERLLGKPFGLDPRDVATITTNDQLNIAHRPVVPHQDLEENGSIRRVFKFLQRQGKIPASVSWEKIAASFDQTMIVKVMADEEKYRLHEYDYAQ